MHVLVIGNSSNLDELKQKFGSNHVYLFAQTDMDAMKRLGEAEIIFDFIPTKEGISTYKEFKNPVFINVAFRSLSDLTCETEIEMHDLLFGFIGLPTFLNRPVFEITISSKSNEGMLKSICDKLKTEFVLVKDQAGLVTARVICMIINEAYYTLEEGTATRDDIDLAMKLGTNYPFGPFEWATQIGKEQVINLLDAVYHDTGDLRYRICNLLRLEIKN